MVNGVAVLEVNQLKDANADNEGSLLNTEGFLNRGSRPGWSVSARIKGKIVGEQCGGLQVHNTAPT